MLDGALKPKIDPLLAVLARGLVATGFSANGVTLAGLVIGLAGAAAIAWQSYGLGLALLLVSRLMDGLDGAVARIRGSSDFGGYIDIVFDFVFYGAIPLGFAIANPSANALAACALVFSFYVNGASFLAFAIMAEKHKLTTDQRGKKSFFFTTGLAEATETFAIFAAFCIWPQHFALIAYGFAAVCIYTASVRIWQTRALIG